MFNSKILKILIIFLVAVIIVSVVLLAIVLSDQENEHSEQSNVVNNYPQSELIKNEGDEFEGLFPFSLSREQIEESITQGQPIVITPVKLGWSGEVNDSLIKNGWKLVGLDRFNDGGSSIYNYFKTKDSLALSIFYQWDLTKGKYKGAYLSFIQPSKICELMRRPLFLEDGVVDINSLIDCHK